MTRDPDAQEEPQVKGGRAAQRLREFLAARFGDEAPPIPPDEEEAEEGAPPETAEDRDRDS